MLSDGAGEVNGDGVLERDLGDRELELSFELRTNGGNKDRELTVRRLEQEFRAIGARPRVVFEEWAKFVSRIDAKDFDTILLAWNLSFDPDDTARFDLARASSASISAAVGRLGRAMTDLAAAGHRGYRSSPRPALRSSTRPSLYAIRRINKVDSTTSGPWSSGSWPASPAPAPPFPA
jgi:hypothetical protein